MPCTFPFYCILCIGLTLAHSTILFRRMPIVRSTTSISGLPSPKFCTPGQWDPQWHQTHTIHPRVHSLCNSRYSSRSGHDACTDQTLARTLPPDWKPIWRSTEGTLAAPSPNVCSPSQREAVYLWPILHSAHLSNRTPCSRLGNTHQGCPMCGRNHWLGGKNHQGRSKLGVHTAHTTYPSTRSRRHQWWQHHRECGGRCLLRDDRQGSRRCRFHWVARCGIVSGRAGRCLIGRNTTEQSTRHTFCFGRSYSLDRWTEPVAGGCIAHRRSRIPGSILRRSPQPC